MIAGIEGVYRSTDQGATWTRIGDYQAAYQGPPRTILGDMNTFGRTYLATPGNGFLVGSSASGS